MSNTLLRGVTLGSLGLTLITSALAQSQWTYSDINDVSFNTSIAYDVAAGDYAAGVKNYTFAGYGVAVPSQAVIWHGYVPTDVVSTGVTASVIFASDGNDKVGQALAKNVVVAALWSGAGSLFTSLNPSRSSYSSASGLYGNQQVGWAQYSREVVPHAILWTGTAASAVDLHPAPEWSDGSRAYGIGSNVQVGTVAGPAFSAAHACRWLNTATTFLDMHPYGFQGSAAFHVNGGLAVGFGYNLDPNTGQFTGRQAYLWSTSTGSGYSLHPAGIGAVQSEARGIMGSSVVGKVYSASGTTRALFWNLSTATNFDLSSVLLAGYYTNSGATSVWTDGFTYRVSGFATYIPTGQTHAIVWTHSGFPQP